MSDVIEIRGLRAVGTHGVLPEELVRAQPFEVDLDIETSFAVAARSDDLAHTIDYGPIVESVCTVVESSHFVLLEALAEAIADAVLADARTDAVTVALRKLRPPLAADVGTVGVRVVRRQAEAAGSPG